MARVLVTGANGFVGQNLVGRLVCRGDDVTCLVRKTSLLEPLKPYDVRIVLGDVTGLESLADSLCGVDVVYHVAGCVRAWDPQDMFHVNEVGTAAVADACASRTSPPILVYVSSLAAAGPSSFDRPHVETDPDHPLSFYGRSKLAAERQLEQRAARQPISIVRPPIVFGRGGRDAFPMFRSVQLRLHFVPGFRPQRFSLIDAGDLAEMLICTAERGRRLTGPDDPFRQGLYYATLPEIPTYAELGQLIAEALACPYLLTIPTPHALGWLLVGINAIRSRLRGRPLLLNADKMRDATAGSWTCCGDRASEQLGFRPAATLQQRLVQAVQWYRQQNWL